MLHMTDFLCVFLIFFKKNAVTPHFFGVLFCFTSNSEAAIALHPKVGCFPALPSTIARDKPLCALGEVFIIESFFMQYCVRLCDIDGSEW